MPTDVVAAGKSVWVSGGFGDRYRVDYPNAVIRIDMATTRRIAIIPVSDPAALAADRHSIWALSSGGPQNFSQLRRIDISRNRVTASVRIRGTSFRPALAVGGGFVWVLTAVGNGEDRRWIVTRVSIATNRPYGRRITVDGIGQDIAFRQGAVWVSTISTRGRRVLGELIRIPIVRGGSVVTQSLPSAGLLAAQGNTVWVVTGARRITPIDARSGRLKAAAISVPIVISSLAADAHSLWIVDRLRKTVALVRV